MPNVKCYYIIMGIFDYKYLLKLTTNSMTASYLYPVITNDLQILSYNEELLESKFTVFYWSEGVLTTVFVCSQVSAQVFNERLHAIKAYTTPGDLKQSLWVLKYALELSESEYRVHCHSEKVLVEGSSCASKSTRIVMKSTLHKIIPNCFFFHHQYSWKSFSNLKDSMGFQ